MFNKLFDHAANTFGSFNRGDGVTIVAVVFTGPSVIFEAEPAVTVQAF